VRYDQVNVMLLNEFLKEHSKVEKLESTVVQQQKKVKDLAQLGSIVAKQEATIAEQQKQFEALTATVHRVSDQIQLSKPAPQMVAND